MYRHDPRMVEACGRAGFAQEALGFLSGELAFPWQLDGHRAVQFRVVRCPDFAESADSDPIDQFEMAEGLSFPGDCA